MGLFKKVFKPVSKVLDKIIPNEIKPALPYLAAFAPVFGPTAGMFGSTMGRRALTSGLLNIGSQLAQEGNEGDINLLSAGLGALSGAMTTPNAAGEIGKGASTQFKNMQTYGGRTLADIGEGTIAAEATGLEALKNKSLGFLSEGSDIFAAGAADPFSTAGLKAAAIPTSQGTMDNLFAQAKRDQDEYNRMMDDGDSEVGASDSDRAFAIRQSMESYGFTEQEILDAIEAAGYKTGGRVGLKGGGMDYMETEPGILGNPAVMEKIENMREFKIMNPDIEDITDYSEKYKFQKPDFNNIDETVEIVDNQEIEESQDKIKDSMFVSIAKEIGPMLLGVPGMMYKISSDAYKMYQNLEQKDKDKVMDISEKIVDVVNYTTPAGLAIKTGEFVKEKIQNKKDGGLMNLGGKEMDMRTGGFIPIGKKERADDVPARLSKNEFVMTADAVRAAGGGSVNKGAKRMYDLMNNLEARV